MRKNRPERKIVTFEVSIVQLQAVHARTHPAEQRKRMLRKSLCLIVGVPAMRDFYDQHDHFLVFYAADDPVVADAIAP